MPQHELSRVSQNKDKSYCSLLSLLILRRDDVILHFMSPSLIILKKKIWERYRNIGA